MKVFLASACSVAALAISGQAQADDAESRNEIIVTGAAASQQSTSATGLPLSIANTPQAVTIVDSQQIADFKLTNVNDLLDQVPAVNVERGETDRTEYDSRGFQISNFQID